MANGLVSDEDPLCALSVVLRALFNARVADRISPEEYSDGSMHVHELTLILLEDKRRCNTIHG
jgi:hypothetical protein